MKVPLFLGIRETIPDAELELGEIADIIRTNPELKQATHNARHGGDKRDLPIVCLGGCYQPCDGTAEHGDPQFGRTCNQYGYRNMAHIDWKRRTGIVLLDFDLVEDAWSFEAKLQADPHVRILWTSASGKGFKAGIAVEPVPLSNQENWTAWAEAKRHFERLLEGRRYRIDPTKSAANVAILAHDPEAFHRALPQRIHWEPEAMPIKPITLQAPTVLKVKVTPEQIASTLSWQPGDGRSHSLYMFGLLAAMRGCDPIGTEAYAIQLAHQTGLVKDYGEKPAIRNFHSGWRQGLAHAAAG